MGRLLSTFTVCVCGFALEQDSLACELEDIVLQAHRTEYTRMHTTTHQKQILDCLSSKRARGHTAAQQNAHDLCLPHLCKLVGQRPYLNAHPAARETAHEHQLLNSSSPTHRAYADNAQLAQHVDVFLRAKLFFFKL